MENIEYYEKRFISKTNRGTTDLFFNNTAEYKTLKEYIFEFDKIILLGNPGIGKTKELDNLFETLWKEKEDNGLIPYSINLKKFRKVNVFEDLIDYDDWKDFPSIIFILDGLDEIAEITDFLSAFELFISQNKLLNIKYVLSCRTNIYEKYLVNILDFETFFLDNLTLEQDKSILENKYQIPFDELIIEDKHLNYLKTPFFLKLFAEYYRTNAKMPQSDSEVWELFIEMTINEHKKKLIKREILNKPQLIKELKKVAFVNELMQKNYVSEEELYEILGKEYLKYIENPFIVEFKDNSKKWSFNHRQIQEYFVAKILKEKQFEDVIKIIKIPNIEIIHPSLFNTITFLINIIEKESEIFKKLIDWILNNQIELLFRADSDRINDNLRSKVFQRYFTTECIEKTFWISTNKTFSEQEIAIFADCDDNYNYLIKIVKENELHFRVIISALRLIKYFAITKERSKDLKIDFIILLKSDLVDIRIKAQIIECIESLDLCKIDNVYQKQIFEIFKNESSKELNRRLLAILVNYENIDEYFDYIKEEFLRDNEIIKREIIDEVRRGNNWVLESLVLRLKNANYFVDVISYYFQDKYHVELSTEFSKEIKTKFLKFIKDDSDLIIRFFSIINNETKYFKQEYLLISIIIESSSQNLVTKHLLDNNHFSEIYHFLAHFITKEGINLIVKKYDQGSDTSLVQNIEVFRNVIANTNNREIAGLFNDLMIKKGYQFKDKFLTNQEVEKIQKAALVKPQINFDKLFDKENLIYEVEAIFKEHGGLINQNILQKIELDWYEKNGHGSTYINAPISLLRSIIYRQRLENVNFEEFKELMENDFIIFDAIKNSISRNKNSSIKFVITQAQESKILKWCNEAIENLNFDRMIILHSVDSFSFLPDYEVFKNILFFQDEFNFKLPQSFLLDSIQFYGMENSHDDVKLNILFDRIGNEELFNKKIIENINNKNLFSITLNKHIDYAIEKVLKEAFPTIREHFSEGRTRYINDNVLENYIKISNDFSLLKELSEDINNHICWTSLKILTLFGEEKELTIQKSIEYLNQNANTLFSSTALGFLFHYNQKEALEYFYKLINEDITPYFNGTEYANYTVENYELLEKLFIAIYVKGEEKLKFGNHFTFFNIYVSNLSKNDESYKKTQEILKKLKQDQETSRSDSGIFYINQQIDNSTNSYINSKSKPLSFKEALAKVEEIIK